MNSHIRNRGYVPVCSLRKGGEVGLNLPYSFLRLLHRLRFTLWPASCTQWVSFQSPLMHVCLIPYPLIHFIIFQNIKKDIKKYQRMFEIKDRMSQSRASKVNLITVSIFTPSACLSLSQCMSACLPACLPACLSKSVSVCVPSIWVFVCLSLSLFSGIPVF